MFKDEPDTLKQVQALAARTYELAEFLLFVCKVQLKDSGEPVKVALHTSCSARREMNTHLHGRELLAQLSNVERVDHEPRKRMLWLRRDIQRPYARHFRRDGG